ncbi:MAG: hypothetical protein AAF583_05975 [Pseudomonadota bacterium]
MNELWLHIGHGKTGSSYLQAVLAQSLVPLEKEGFTYPVNDSVHAAQKNRVSAGNAGVLLSPHIKTLDTDTWRADVSRNERRKYLFSGEAIFYRLANGTAQDRILEILSSHNITKIFILAFIRNPVEHVWSAYQQFVQKQGFAGPVDVVLGAYKEPHAVRALLEEQFGLPNTEVRVVNYSANRTRIVDTLADWLRVPRRGLNSPAANKINRSLTDFELALMRSLNAEFGQRASSIADELIRRFPDLNAGPIRAPSHLIEAMLDRLADDLQAVNRLLQSDQQYDLNYTFPQQHDSSPVTDEYLAVLTDLLASELGMQSAERVNI